MRHVLTFLRPVLSHESQSPRHVKGPQACLQQSPGFRFLKASGDSSEKVPIGHILTWYPTPHVCSGQWTAEPWLPLELILRVSPPSPPSHARCLITEHPLLPSPPSASTHLPRFSKLSQSYFSPHIPCLGTCISLPLFQNHLRPSSVFTGGLRLFEIEAFEEHYYQ